MLNLRAPRAFIYKNRLYKHLIGIEPIIFCFEGNRFTDLAKDVKLF